MRFCAFLFAILLAGCATHPASVTFHAEDNPQNLADWGLFTLEGGRIAPHQGMITYELNSSLFSDYAQKWRTVWMPKGVAAKYDPEKAFDFPVGTIITKTFYYSVPTDTARPGDSKAVLKVTPATYQPGVTGLGLAHVRLIETRLLVKRANGWDALPYVWNAEQTAAELTRAGAELPLELVDRGTRQSFVYSVPNANQCAGCHATDYTNRKLMPIGLKARHLNRAFTGQGGEINQLRRLVAAGYLTGLPGGAAPNAAVARNADWQNAAAGGDARARAYLDINCSHCHSAVGAARTSGLWLDAKTTVARLRGACKPPVAAGRGTGDLSFDIVPGQPDASILPYRMASTDPGEMMPELGRSLAHKEAVKVISDWILHTPGDCVVEGKPE